MIVNSLLSETWVSEKSGLSFFSTFYDGGKQRLLRGREVIHLCHQFFPSSLSRREACLTSSKTFSLKMNKLRGALLLSYNIGGQDQETRQMGDPLRHSRLCCTVCLRRKHLCAKLQMTVASHRKRSGVRFVLLVVAPRPL